MNISEHILLHIENIHNFEKIIQVVCNNTKFPTYGYFLHYLLLMTIKDDLYEICDYCFTFSPLSYTRQSIQIYVPNISIDRDRHRESLIIFHDQDSTSPTVSRKDRYK